MRRALLVLVFAVCLAVLTYRSAMTPHVSDVAIGTAGIGSAAPFRTSTMGRTQAGTGSPPIAVGQKHTLLIEPDGTIWGWGFKDKGQVGAGTDTGAPPPRRGSAPTDARAMPRGHPYRAED